MARNSAQGDGATAIALSALPRDWGALRLKALVLAHDGAAAESLRAAAEARRRAPRGAPRFECQLMCIEAIAHASLGRSDESVRLRVAAAQLWPDCDLLPTVDAAVAAATT